MFNDNDIRTELEEFHIRKDNSEVVQSDEGEIDIEDTIKDCVNKL